MSEFWTATGAAIDCWLPAIWAQGARFPFSKLGFLSVGAVQLGAAVVDADELVEVEKIGKVVATLVESAADDVEDVVNVIIELEDEVEVGMAEAEALDIVPLVELG